MQAPLIVLLALLCADVALTAYCLRHGGSEANPLYRAALRRLPWPAALGVYALAWACIIGAARMLGDEALVVLAVVVAIAVLANAQAARRVRR